MQVGADDRRCLLDTKVPITSTADNNHVQILQTPRYIALLHEKIHDVRIIPLTDQASVLGRPRQWLGASQGRWEGETLVVETSGFLAQDPFGWGLTRHVVERFTRTGEDALEYSYTVTDPRVWTQPWSAMVPWRQADGPIFEYACHEGNYAMPLMLRGALVAEPRP